MTRRLLLRVLALGATALAVPTRFVARRGPKVFEVSTRSGLHETAREAQAGDVIRLRAGEYASEEWRS